MCTFIHGYKVSDGLSSMERANPQMRIEGLHLHSRGMISKVVSKGRLVK